MHLEITKAGNWQGAQYKITSPDVNLFTLHQCLPLALSNFATLLQEYYQSLKSREPQLALNLKRELELLKEMFE